MKTLFFFLLISTSSASIPSSAAYQAEKYIYDFSISKIEFSMTKTLLSQYKVDTHSDIYTKSTTANIKLFNSFASTYNGKSCNPSTFEIQVLKNKPFYTYYSYKYAIESILQSQQYIEAYDAGLYINGGIFYKKNNTILATLFHKVSPTIFVWTACTLR